MRSWKRPAFATVLFAAYWLPWLFGLVDLDRGEWPLHTRELFYGLAVFLPCAIAGAVHGRWWAPVMAALFVLVTPLPDRCTRAVDGDVVDHACWGMDLDELPQTLALTVPSIIAGVLAAALVAGTLTWRRRHAEFSA